MKVDRTFAEAREGNPITRRAPVDPPAFNGALVDRLAARGA
nr:hypothetical protein [Burkholderia sp. BCC1977]